MQTQNQAFNIDDSGNITTGNLTSGQRLQDDIAEALNFVLLTATARAAAGQVPAPQGDLPMPPALPAADVVAPVPGQASIENHPAAVALRAALTQETAAGQVIHRTLPQ
jgi:hypothetical protein